MLSEWYFRCWNVSNITKGLWWRDYVTKNAYKWYRDFKEDRERVDDLQRSGRPSTLIDDQNINKIKERVLGNPRLTIRELVDMVGISFGSGQTILKNHSGPRRVKSSSKKSVAFKQLKQCFLTTHKFLHTNYYDESWIYAFDSETTDQSSEYTWKGEAKPKRPR